MADIILGMDVSQTTTAARQFVASLRDMDEAAVELGSTLATFNAKGDATKVVLEGLTPIGQKVKQTFAEIDGAMSHIGTSIEGATAALARFNDTQRLTAAALERTAAAARAEGIVRAGIGGGIEGANIAQINTVERAIAKVRDMIESGKASEQDFQAALAAVGSTGAASFDNLTAGAQRLAVELRNILQVEQSIGDATKRAADAATAALEKEANAARAVADAQRATKAATARGALAETALRTTFGLPEGADAASVAKFEALITRIKAAVASGAVSVQEFNRILQSVRADPAAGLTGLSTAAQKVANDMRSLAKETDAVGETGKKAGEKILISWQGVVRLFESQVIRQSIHAIENQFRTAITAAADFSVKIAEIQTISQDSGISTKEWADNVRKLAAEFGRNEADVAEAAYQTLSNQVVKGRDVFTFLEQALKFAQATNSTTADSVNLLTGALKGFNIDASKTTEVAAQLFSTIELGRVRANELANSYGRSAIVSRSLGVSMKELDAAIVTLTDQGLKFNVAQTFIINLMTKLLDPTKEMKKAFDAFGVASGPALIQKLGGFKGFLQFLDTEGQKGAQRIEELTGGMRSIQGALGLTGPAFATFDATLKKFADSEEKAAKATEIVNKAVGTELQKNIVKTKTFFEEGFGEPFVKGLNSVIESLGGVEKILGTVVDLLKTGVQIFVAYKVAAVAAGVANLGFAGTFAALKVDALAALGAVRSLATAYGAVVAAQGLFQRQGPVFDFGTKIGQAIFGEAKDPSGVFKQALDDATKRNEEFAKNNADLLKERKDGEKKLSEALSLEIDKRFAKLLDNSASVVKLSAEVRDAQIRYLKEVTEAAKIAGDTFESSIRLKIQKMTEDIRRSVEDVRKSQKAVIEAPDKGAGRIFDFKLQFADDRQQLDLIDQRINVLRKRGTDLFKESTRESVEEARKLFDQIEELETRRQAKLAEIQKRRFEFTGQGPTIVTTDIATQERRVELVIDTATHEARVKAIVAERIKLEENFQKKAKQFQDEQTKAREAEKTRLDTIQKLIKRATEFSVLDETGKVQPKFTKTPLGLDPAGAAKRAGEDFQAIIDEINKNATTEEKKQFTFFVELQKQKQAIINEVQSVIRTEEAKTTQQGILNDKEKFKTSQAQNEKEIEDAKKKSDEISKFIHAELETYKEVAKSTGAVTDALSSKQSVAITRSADARAKAIKEADRALQAEKEFSEEPTKRNARILEDAISRFKEAFRELERVRFGREFPEGGVGIKTPERTFFLKEDIDQLRQKSSELVDQQTIIDKGNAKVEAAISILKRLNEQEDPGAKFKAIGENAQAAGKSMVSSFAVASEQIDITAAKVENLRQKLQDLQDQIPKKNIPLPQLPTPEEGKSWGGLIHYFSSGGFVTRGRDRIPAMLAAGEMVMNPEATQRWYPVLSAMNARQPVRYFSQGGPVTNVGDINITVRGGSTSNETLQEVAQGLRRGLRRGTITLGD